MNKETVIHLLAGGIAGTTSAVVTCPLEVVKTRLQSSGLPSIKNSNSNTASTSSSSAPHQQSSNKAAPSEVQKLRRPSRTFASLYENSTFLKRRSSGNVFLFRSLARQTVQHPSNELRRLSLLQNLKLIVVNEGVLGLWKGLLPTLVGVAPSRAIYFCAYSNAKILFNETFVPDTPIVHICSAATAGFCSASCTNPIWLIRTRMQLDRKRLTILTCIRKIYSENGLRGFYRGVTASYAGLSETIIHFVIYEQLKMKFVGDADDGKRPMSDFLLYMLCAGSSRMVATSIAYPHEVARTRLREEGSRYRGFFHAITTVAREESFRGLYGGLSVHLLRSIPNTAIMMATYELVVYSLQSIWT